jgi:predicted TPR repeat methyltransferase
MITNIKLVFSNARKTCREIIVDILNRSALPRLLMNSRTVVKKYFDHKYKREDPYKISAIPSDTRYTDMLDLLRNNKYSRVLDVGCGEGIFSGMLLEISDSVEGIDISESAIIRAREKYRGYPSLSFAVQDIVNMDSDIRYDLIVCAEILYYLNFGQLLKVISKIIGWLAPGGYLLVGNINKIRSKSGFFRSYLSSKEISEYVKKTGNLHIVGEMDRGGDILTLFRKHS